MRGFLVGHDIARSTAYRVLQEYAEPEKKEKRRAAQAQRNAAVWAKPSPWVTADPLAGACFSDLGSAC